MGGGCPSYKTIRLKAMRMVHVVEVFAVFASVAAETPHASVEKDDLCASTTASVAGVIRYGRAFNSNDDGNDDDNVEDDDVMSLMMILMTMMLLLKISILLMLTILMMLLM